MKNKIIKVLMVSMVGVLSFFFGPILLPSIDHDHIEGPQPLELYPIIEPVEVPEILEEEILTPILKVEETSFAWPEELRRICSCESNGHPGGEPRHYDSNGEVLRGRVNPLDLGQCQINLKYHGERSFHLGIDLYTPEGNFEYAMLLYREQGSTPWNWSRSCWSK